MMVKRTPRAKQQYTSLLKVNTKHRLPEAGSDMEKRYRKCLSSSDDFPGSRQCRRIDYA